MTDAPRTVPAPPEDPDLPRVADLFHREPSTSVLSRFLEARGYELVDSRVAQALYRPTRGCTVRFNVKARPHNGTSPRNLSLCLRTRAKEIEPVAPPEDFGQRFGIDDPIDEIDGIRAWVFPYDPVLPGMPDGAHGPTIRDASGIKRPAAVSVTPLRYRPGQRAAFKYTVVGLGGVREILYGKVVGPKSYQRIFDAYRSYARTGITMVTPVPAGDLPGIALFPEISGTCLRDVIEDGGQLPSPERLIGLLERLAHVRWLGDPDTSDEAYSIKASGRLLAHILPHRRHEIRAAYRELADRVSQPLPDVFTIHGDLYEGQIFVGDDFSIGLIDLEDGGPGDPLMDAANMLAHLRVLHAYSPDAGGRPLAYRVMLRKALLDHLGGGEEEVVWREALCAMHLATGPFRVQSPDWPVETEQRVDEVLALMRTPSLVAA